MELPIVQVITPESTTDYFSVWVNAGAVFLGVIISFALNLLDRKRTQEVTRRNDLICNYNYLSSFFAANMELLQNAIMDTINISNSFRNDNLILRHGKTTFIEMDYSKVQVLNNNIPDLLPTLAVKINKLKSIAFLHDHYLKNSVESLIEPAKIAQDLYVLLDDLIWIFKDFDEMSSHFLKPEKLDAYLNAQRSIWYFWLEEDQTVFPKYIFPDKLKSLLQRAEAEKNLLASQYSDAHRPSQFYRSKITLKDLASELR